MTAAEPTRVPDQVSTSGGAAIIRLDKYPSWAHGSSREHVELFAETG